MKRNTTRFLMALLIVLSLCFLCTACGGGAGNAESVKSSTARPQDDPNEGLGGDFPARNESTGNVTGLCEGFWLGTRGNDYDYIEFDAEGAWKLYTGGYVLVDFNSFIASNEDLTGNRNFSYNPVLLPEGKKPIMITETMVNYFDYMIDGNKDGEPDAGGAGFASKLIVDTNGDIKAQMVDASGQTQVGDFDLVPVLETFISEHPDFSYRGARATLAVTGTQGIFGYRTNTSYISSVN